MKSALVVEGGAMRGIFAAGVLDKFMEANYFPFDFGIGVSAGATNLSTYVTRAHGLSRTIITEFATRREFYNPVRFIQGGHMTDVHWLWHHAKKNLGLPMPSAKSAFPMYVGITNVDNGQCEYHLANTENVDKLMVASCAIPTAYREQPVINGQRYVDGGVADAIPVKQAYDMGARNITVILSQVRGFIKPAMKSTWLLERLYGHQPALLQTLIHRFERYNESLAFIEKPPVGCHITVIAPSQSFCVKRLTMNKAKLLKGYAQGRRMGRRALHANKAA